MACANCFFNHSVKAIYRAPIIGKVFLRECCTLRDAEGKRRGREEILGMLH